MSEVKPPYDRPVTDTWESELNELPLGVHLYAMDMSKKFDPADEPYTGQFNENLRPFTNSGVVMSFLYCPFMDTATLNTYKIPYDQKYFGSVSNKGTAFEPNVHVWKVLYNQGLDGEKQMSILSKQLEVPVYPFINNPPRNTNASWENESKLYQFPYHYVTINDYINPPLVLKPHLNPESGGYPFFKMYTRQMISLTGGYNIFCEGYNGDKDGYLEGIVCNAGLDLPVTSSEYSQFMARSKNQFISQNNASSRNEWVNFGRGAISTVTGAFQAGLGAIAIAGSSGTATMMGAGSMIGAGAMTMGQGIADMVQSATSTTNRVENSQAKVNDLMSAPRNATLGSSDILSALARNDKKVWALRYTIDPYYRDKLANYWMLYGYKQNKFMKVRTNDIIKSRKRFNYIRTLQANIKGYNMDSEDIEMVASIFDKGIRFWHISTGNEQMHDYSLDNKEVWA